MTLSEQPMRRDPVNLLAALVFLAGAAAAAYVWRYGPAGSLPMHLDLRGHVNGWGDRTTVAGVVAGLTAGFAAIFVIMETVTLSAGAEAAPRRGVRIAKLLLVYVEIMTVGLMLALAYGGASAPELGGGRLMPAILALLFLVVGAFMGKAGPNPFVGVRTYWTFRSRLAWDKSNRLSGRLFFWIGLVGLIASPFLAPSVTTPALIAAILLAALASVLESWRVWRTDPERRQP